MAARPAMDVAFVVDPLDELKAYKDSSIAMMRALARRGHRVHAMLQADLAWSAAGTDALQRELDLRDDDHDWYRAHEPQRRRLADSTR
jgi:glutathione synthase